MGSLVAAHIGGGAVIVSEALFSRPLARASRPQLPSPRLGGRPPSARSSRCPPGPLEIGLEAFWPWVTASAQIPGREGLPGPWTTPMSLPERACRGAASRSIPRPPIFPARFPGQELNAALWMAVKYPRQIERARPDHSSPNACVRFGLLGGPPALIQGLRPLHQPRAPALEHGGIIPAGRTFAFKIRRIRDAHPSIDPEHTWPASDAAVLRSSPRCR